jgi:putative CocE/NonD family hydrolase
MYHVTSWYDIFLHGGIANFQGLRHSAKTEPARAAQKLLIGPWAHLFPYTSPTSTGTGEIDFGSAALVDLHETQLRWFDHWLKGVDTGILDEPPVRIFVMGDNRWRDEHEWPLARTRYTPYYLGGGGRANTAGGDGTLGPAAPAEDPPDHFVYDPADPVPTRGGNTLILAMGVMDQRPVEARADVLVYTSEVMTAGLEVTGPSWSRSTPQAPRPTPISPRSSSTCTPTGMPGTWPTASSAPAIATRGPPQPSSRQVKSRNLPSTSGPRATSSCPATASASRSRRATSRASIAT